MIELLRAAVAVDGGISGGRVYGDAAGSAGRMALSVDGGISTGGRVYEGKISAGVVYGDAAGSAGRMSLSADGGECRYSIGGEVETIRMEEGASNRSAKISARYLEAIGTIRAGVMTTERYEEAISHRLNAGVSHRLEAITTIRADEGASNRHAALSVDDGASNKYLEAGASNRLRADGAGSDLLGAAVIAWDLPGDSDTTYANAVIEII